MKKYRCVPEKELIAILEAANKYWALENGGVDNWSWYGTSCQDYINDWRDRKKLDPSSDWTFQDIAAEDVYGYPSIEF